MRKLAIIILIAMMGLSPSLIYASSSNDQKQQIDLIDREPADHVYPIVLAAGALAGVLSVNWLTHSFGNLPVRVGMETTAPVVSPAVAAASRIFVITSGVLGAWIADFLYQ